MEKKFKIGDKIKLVDMYANSNNLPFDLHHLEIGKEYYITGVRGEEYLPHIYILGDAHGWCVSESMMELVEDIATTQIDWSESETGLLECWKSPFNSLETNLLIADGAIAWRDKVIANLRKQIKDLKEK